MNNKNDNKSLFIYTALIFVVAVLLIILSFFGQTNLQKKQPNVEENTTATGISERASVLSEENKTLIEENTSLENENTQLSEENDVLKTENETLVNYKNINELLLSANGYYTLGNDTKALEILNTINYDELTGDQKILYDTLKNNL